MILDSKIQYGGINMLKGKHVLLGISGGIAAYKIANLTSMLKKAGCDVKVIMTQNATNFIHPTVFETLTGHKCMIDTFDRNFQFDVEHISLAKWSDLLVIAPATANVIGKMANGIADDMLTTTVLAAKCPKLVSPAMNTNMYENPIVLDNMERLKKYGFQMIEPATGHLACGDNGKGKLPSEQEIFDTIEYCIGYEKDLVGKKVLVTAGPTQEAIDPVRYLTNHSSGKMGYAIAKAAMLRGANVTLVSGPVSILSPKHVNLIPVRSAKDMFEAVVAESDSADIIIKAAAVADYTPANYSDEKIKKSDSEFCIELNRTTDILAYLGSQKKEKQFICGFAMETENLLENSRKKLQNKNVDLIAANSLKVEGAGFQGDTNVLTLITKDTEVELPLLSKEEAAHQLLDMIIKRI